MQATIHHFLIDNIPVDASPSLSYEEIRALFHDINKSWAWEGRQLGRVEFFRQGQWVHVHMYEKPSTLLIPLSNHIRE